MLLETLVKNPLLLLFLVAAAGYPLGKIRVAGASLGVAAVLFAGLFFGALHPDLKLPELFSLFGLTLFVYTIGLSSGPTFFSSFRKKGLPETTSVVVVLMSVAGLVSILKRHWAMGADSAAGMFAGALNNTPALAGVLDQIKSTGHGVSENAVISYSIVYPLGVLGTIGAIAFCQKLWKIDYRAERAVGLQHSSDGSEPIRNRTILVNRKAAVGLTTEELQAKCPGVLFGRIRRGKAQLLASPDTQIELMDEIVAIGVQTAVEKAMTFLGARAEEDLTVDRSEYDYKRVFLSNRKLVGKKIGKVTRLPEMKRMDATITRVSRGDVEFLATDGFILEPGDRVRLVCRRENMKEACEFFGDSYRAVSEIDLLSFSIGLVLGISLGLIPIPVGSDVTFRLGFAGGPLVVGLILGRLQRTGPIVWALPYGATMILRQIGLVLFLATVGTRAGYAFFHTLGNGQGWLIFLGGALVTFFASFSMLWLGYRKLKIPMGRLVGIVAGLQTQPAVLAYTLEQTGSEAPNGGYAMIHPLATITKILLAQILLGT